jgi:hypothetical protein
VNRGVGVLIGIVVGWIATVLFNLGSARLTRLRLAMFKDDLVESLPWLLLIVGSAALVGVLGLLARQLPGAVFGAGLVMTGLGLILVLAPVRTAFDISQAVIDILDKRSYGAVSLNGTLILAGMGLLGAGIGAFRTDKPAGRPQVEQPQYYSPNQPPGQFPG